MKKRGIEEVQKETKEMTTRDLCGVKNSGWKMESSFSKHLTINSLATGEKYKSVRNEVKSESC